MISPPDDKTIAPAELFRAMLDPRPRRSFSCEFSGVGRAVLFVRATGSSEWTRLHRALVRAVETNDARGEAEYLASICEDERGRPALSADDVLDLYEHESAALFSAATGALRIISPTFAASDVGAWVETLKKGALAPENVCDAASLGGCRSVSWGFGRGAVHVRDEPEAFYGVPRRELVDAHWLAYHAACRVVSEMQRKAG